MRATSTRRRGMTLIELMVVVGIALILALAAIPIMRPLTKDRKVREASRQLNSFITLAKARAAETGRPMGIWIQRDFDASDTANYGLPESSYQIFLAETPPPFAGEALGDAVRYVAPNRFVFCRYVLDTMTMQYGWQDLPQSMLIDPTIVQPGDHIQCNFKGPRYQIGTVDQNEIQITFNPSINVPLPVAPVPFKIFRQPIRASGTPLELPVGVVIDLEYSGSGATGCELDIAVDTNTGKRFLPPYRNPVIMFEPTGRVQSINNQNPNGTIHLLVGRVEQISDLATGASPPVLLNAADATALWVSIGHLTGAVTTAENMVFDPTSFEPNPSNPNFMTTLDPQNVRQSVRTIAQSKQTMGGR
jgi:prepilin-type N-terminal cleavage/methylation domain-containing protein